MPSLKLPSRSVSTRASRSPAPRRGRPNDKDALSRRGAPSPSGMLRPAQSVRSRSHDDRGRSREAFRRSSRPPADREQTARQARRQRRRRDSSASSVSSIDVPQAQENARGNDTTGRRRRSPSSLSPERYTRTRHHSVGGQSDLHRGEGRTAGGGRPILKPEYVPGLKNEEQHHDANRPGTPAKYKPSSSKHAGKNHQGSGNDWAGKLGQPKMGVDSKVANPVASPAPTSPLTTPAAPESVRTPSPAAPTAAARESPARSGGLLSKMPGALSAYAGFQYLTKNADKAKEWTDWFKDLQGVPEEMEELASRVATAKDTIARIQEALSARPDLLEDDAGKRLKEQIDEQIKSTDKALGKMNKMLAELGQEGQKEGRGDIVGGIEKYWKSYRYKDEWEDKIKAADQDLQKELASLSALMANVYSRAIVKPAPAPATSLPQAASGDASAAADPPAPGSAAAPTDVPANATAAASTAATAPPPPADNEIAAPPVQAPADVNPFSPSHVAATSSTGPVKAESPPPTPGLVAANATPRDSASGISPRTSLASAAVADIPSETKRPSVVSAPPPRDSADISPLTSPPPKPSSVAKEEAAVSVAPSARPQASSAAVPGKGGVAPARVPVAPGTNVLNDGAPRDPRKASLPGEGSRKQSPAKDSTDSISSDLEPQDVLLDAAWDGDAEGVAQALRRAPPNSVDLKGHTALHLAAEKDRLAVAIMLLDRGADVHARADGGREALHLASRFASAEMVEVLLERGKADADARDADGRTPLHYAASAARDGSETRRDVIRVLRDWGADPSIADRKRRLPRDVAQARDHWDAAATLRRAEKRWDEEHKQNWLQRHNFLRK